MSFCFKRKESAEKAVRRICRERIDDALKSLRRSNHLEGIHAVRKEIKKLRAVLRLVRDEIEKSKYRKITDVLRTVANHLAGMRDAHVKLNAFEDLTKRFRRQLSAKPFPEIKKALQQNCRDEERKFLKGNSIETVNQILKQSKKRIDDLKLESDGWNAIGPGLKKSYRRGREAFATARDESSPENFHEWRKRVKDLWHQVKLVCPVWPKELKAATGELESLGELLGDDHDLFLIAEFAVGKNFDRDETQALEKLICSRQEELRPAALKAGAKYYSETPGCFCRRIENDWKTGRGEK